MTQAIIDGSTESMFDLNDDGVVDHDDRSVWIRDLKQTYFRDANLDGEFNSSDLVTVFVAGQYEDSIMGNSGWEAGDWNGDADFNTSDLVLAFQDGGYEQGPRAAIQAVPEPTSLVTILTALATGLFARRARRVQPLRGR